MPSSIAGRVYMVTGASSGIGQATAVKLAKLGAAGLALSDVNVEGLQKTKDECSRYESNVTVTRVDVSRNDQVTRWASETVQQFGRLDGAANIAGIAMGDGTTNCETIVSDLFSTSLTPLLLSPESWDRLMDVNLKGVMLCMRAQLPHLPRPGGVIVNISSTSGLRGLPHNAAYSSSKFGVIGLSASAAGEFGPLGIRINSLLPGPVDTAIFRDGEARGLFDSQILSKATCLGRMGQAHEIANVLCFLLSDDASYVTGGMYIARYSLKVAHFIESSRFN
ncbi:hypothetical protein GB937_006057 [Aspergillus fischeri]|nr:hypothetical protein GB937_006057 [Aspergillus fischeri]